MKIGGKPKNLKQNNSRAVFELMRSGENRTVAEIAEQIRLSKTTVKKIFDALVVDGLIRATGKGESTDEGGKKPELYCQNPNYGYTIGIHVTPSEFIVVTSNLAAEVTHREIAPVTTEATLDGLVERCATAIESLLAAKAASGEKLLGIVLGLTGLVDAENGVSIHSFFFPDWGRNAPVAARLRERLGASLAAPIFIDNTNRFQALAESERGLAQGCRNFMVVDALAEGLGSGVVLDGHILHGRQSIAGEIGHMTLAPRDGYPCVCGNSGCFEAMVSERRLVALATERLSDFQDSVLNRRQESATGVPPITLEDICRGAEGGDMLCRDLIDDAAGWYVIGLGNAIMMNDPELIVLRGIYTKAGPYFRERIESGLQRIGLPHVEKKVAIAYSQMGDERGMIGGALTAISAYLSNHVY